ncbi:MAG: DUF2298 domain-containing protein [Anaerolineales bacterium]
MSFFIWYLLITLLGWLSFPLMVVLFPALQDRGYTLSRAAGLLLWAYFFWMFASLGVAQNDAGGLFLALALVIALSGVTAFRHQSEIAQFLKSNFALIFIGEALFLAAFGFLALLRAANPELYSTEKPMELAFISGILRSPSFPPQDPWLSGYSISYYYFGYVMTAMLARLSGVTPSMAHNLMTALTFALAALGSFGVLYNLLPSSVLRPPSSVLRPPSSVLRPPSSVLRPLLAPLFLLLVSNAEALLEILHRKGFFWTQTAEGWTSSFWTWLDMKELSLPPIQPLQWTPDRYLWWWRASRVIQDYDLVGSPREVIDEFPFFSFLLGDLHPHVLAIPFTLLAIAVSLHILTHTSEKNINLFGARLFLSPEHLAFSALTLGGLAFLNTWDILPAGALMVAAYVLARVRADGWRWDRLEDALLFALPLGVLSALLYLPFYLGFSSQAGGILPNVMFITRGAHLWVMWGTLLVPIFSFLIYLTQCHSERSEESPKLLQNDSHPNWTFALSFGIGFALFLWAFSWLLGWLGTRLESGFVQAFLAAQGMSASEFFLASSLRRVANIFSLLTLLALLIPALAHLLSGRRQAEFPLLLAVLGALLVLAPEFVYLRDQFGYRINTVFKFYYQAWILWSLVAAYAAAYLLRVLNGVPRALFRAALSLVIFVGLLYPIYGALNKTNNFNPPFGFTLDDFDRIRRENPDEAAAIDFLRSVPNGVIAEAVGDGYSAYARISAHTGLQTVLGWTGHEAQWRGSYAPQGARREGVMKLYVSSRWEEARAIIAQYNIRYIYIGGLERASMRVNEEKFKLNLKVIFQQGDVTIYQTP